MHVRSYVCYEAMLPGPPVRSYVCYEAMFNHIFVMSGRLKLWCSRTLTIDLEAIDGCWCVHRTTLHVWPPKNENVGKVTILSRGTGTSIGFPCIDAHLIIFFNHLLT